MTLQAVCFLLDFANLFLPINPMKRLWLLWLPFSAYADIHELDSFSSENATLSRTQYALKTEQTLFKSGLGGAVAYRIPSLLTTQKGTLISAIDKRNQHELDWGNIDTVIRRSEDGGETWSEMNIVLDLPEQPYGTQHSAFLIDPQMVQDRETGRIFMLVDMFPETKGFLGIRSKKSAGTGHEKINGRFYRQLKDKQGNLYTVREEGNVYDQYGNITDYRVIIEGNADIDFRDLGDLYKGQTRLGNIFLLSQGAQSDSAPLSVHLTNYLWLTYSDDEGKTWSNPVDITAQVKEDWMVFLGTGPGTGIQLKNGNLVMPIYYTNLHQRHSSAVIISSDNGKTWVRGESPNDSFLRKQGGSKNLRKREDELTESQLIELDNGVLKMFSRNLSGKVRISTSYDGGYHWDAEKTFDSVLLDPDSQMSVIKYSRRINNKEYVLFANPHSSRIRFNGKVWLGEVQTDNSIHWKYATTINQGLYGYNSLAELPNGDIGLLYEAGVYKTQYVRFNLVQLLRK